MAEKHREIGERHLELLRVTADLARNDPAAVAQMYTAAQRMNLNTVGKQADRAEFLALVRGLEGEGWVEVRGMGLAACQVMPSTFTVFSSQALRLMWCQTSRICADLPLAYAVER